MVSSRSLARGVPDEATDQPLSAHRRHMGFVGRVAIHDREHRARGLESGTRSDISHAGEQQRLSAEAFKQWRGLPSGPRLHT